MKLVALRCPQCDTWLQPEERDVVQLCPHCQTAVFFSEQGPQAIDVQFGAPEAGAEGVEWYPFWLLPTRVKITSRRVQSGSETDAEMAQRFWAALRPIFVPAWDLPARAAREMGSSMLHQTPVYHTIDQPENVVLHTATLDPVDARKLLEFIILSIEAERRDWLRDFEFQVEVGAPQLWALPLQEKNGRFHLAAATANGGDSDS